MEIRSAFFRQFFADINLFRLIDLAGHNNPDMNIALQRVVAVKADIRYVQAVLAPQLSIAVQAQKEGGRATELAVQQFRGQLLHTQSFEYEMRSTTTAICTGLYRSLGGGWN